MTSRLHNYSSSRYRRKSTIVIEEEEDSLLVEPVIKDFLQTENNAFRNSRSNILANLKPSQLTNNTLMKLSNNSQGFNSTPSTKHKIINPQKLTYISQINLKTFDNWQSSLPYSSTKKQPIQIKPPHSQTPKPRNLMIQKQYSTLLDNRKRWTSHLLQKTIDQTRKKIDKSYQSNYQHNNQNTSKNSPQSIFLKGELLKNVSSSTWMKLNPQNMKQDMILLSKTEKYERKNFFAMKQATLNQQNGIRSLNKLIMLGQSKSEKKLEKNKNQFKLKNDMGIKISLSSKNLVNHKVYERRQKRREQLEKKGIFLRNPFMQRHVTKHDILVNVQSEFL